MIKSTMSAVVTGYEKINNGSYVPTFDVFIDNRKVGELTGGYGYLEPADALNAGVRVVEYLQKHEQFPNLCEEF